MRAYISRRTSEQSPRTNLVHGVILRQCQVLEALGIEFLAERACLELRIVICQSCGMGKFIGTEVSRGYGS